jgi:hypothetical protein
MFTVTVDIWPYGSREKRYEIIKILGYNAGADSDGGYAYHARIFDAKYDKLPTNRDIERGIKTKFTNMTNGIPVNVDNHIRTDGMLELIRRIIVEHDLGNTGRNITGRLV